MNTIHAQKIIFDRQLIASLPASGPRYTSYPTAGRFHSGFGTAEYLSALQNRSPGDELAAALREGRLQRNFQEAKRRLSEIFSSPSKTLKYRSFRSTTLPPTTDCKEQERYLRSNLTPHYLRCAFQVAFCTGRPNTI